MESSGKSGSDFAGGAWGRWPMITVTMASSVAVLILSVFSYFYAFALKDEISPRTMVFVHGFMMGAFWLYHIVTGIRYWMVRFSVDPGQGTYLDMARGRFVTFVFWHYLIFLIWGAIWLSNYNGHNSFGDNQPAPGVDAGAFQFWQGFQALYSLFAMFYAALGFNYASALASSSSPDSDPSAAGGSPVSMSADPSAARRVHIALLALQHFIAFGSSFWMYFIHNGIKSGMSFDGFFWIHVALGVVWLGVVVASMVEYSSEKAGNQIFWSYMELRRPSIFFTMWWCWAFIFYITAVDTSEFKTGAKQDFDNTLPVQSDFYIVLQMFYVCNGILTSYFAYNWITALAVFLNTSSQTVYSLLLNPYDLTDIANANPDMYKEKTSYMKGAYRFIVLITYTYLVIHVMWLFTELGENHDINHYFFDWGVAFAAIAGFLWFLIGIFVIARWIDQSESGAGGLLTITSSFRTFFALTIVIFQGAFGYLWLDAKYGVDGAIPTSTLKDPAEKEYYMWPNNTLAQFGFFFVIILYLGELYFIASITEWTSLSPVQPGSVLTQGTGFLRNTWARTWGTAGVAAKTGTDAATGAARTAADAVEGTSQAVGFVAGSGEMRNRQSATNALSL